MEPSEGGSANTMMPQLLGEWGEHCSDNAPLAEQARKVEYGSKPHPTLEGKQSPIFLLDFLAPRSFMLSLLECFVVSFDFC